MCSQKTEELTVGNEEVEFVQSENGRIDCMKLESRILAVRKRKNRL